MTIPGHRRYSESHQWARADDDGAILVGITDHAQALLGDLVFVESPAMGRNLKIGEQCGVVESVKSASDIYAPVSGEVFAVNVDLDTAPEKNQSERLSSVDFQTQAHRPRSAGDPAGC